MEKYIFLDFDGVLNTPKGKFDKKAIDNLSYLLERSDAKVIISSTWRLQGMEYMQQLWKEFHLPWARFRLPFQGVLVQFFQPHRSKAFVRQKRRLH